MHGAHLTENNGAQSTDCH